MISFSFGRLLSDSALSGYFILISIFRQPRYHAIQKETLKMVNDTYIGKELKGHNN